MKHERSAPEDLHAAFQDAFNRQDVDALIGLYEPEAVLVLAGQSVHGRDAIRAAYEAVLAQRPLIDLQTLGVVRTGDLAMLRGRWAWHAAAPDGTVTRNEGRNVETARRQADGRWLFVIDDPGTA